MKYFEIIERVKSLLDEQTPLNTGLLDEDTVDKPIYAYIVSSLEASWRELVFAAPLYLLPATFGTAAAQSVVIYSLPLPTGFMRAISYKLTLWDTEVQPITVDSPIYALQKNEFTRGTKTRPVAVLKNGTTNNGSIDGYTGNGTTDVAVLLYAKTVDFSNLTGGVEIIEANQTDIVPDNISEAFCCNTAAMVYTIMNETALAGKMIEMRNALL